MQMKRNIEFGNIFLEKNAKKSGINHLEQFDHKGGHKAGLRPKHTSFDQLETFVWLIHN